MVALSSAGSFSVTGLPVSLMLSNKYFFTTESKWITVFTGKLPESFWIEKSFIPSAGFAVIFSINSPFPLSTLLKLNCTGCSCAAIVSDKNKLTKNNNLYFIISNIYSTNLMRY